MIPLRKKEYSGCQASSTLDFGLLRALRGFEAIWAMVVVAALNFRPSFAAICSKSYRGLSRLNLWITVAWAIVVSYFTGGAVFQDQSFPKSQRLYQ